MQKLKYILTLLIAVLILYQIVKNDTNITTTSEKIDVDNKEKRNTNNSDTNSKKEDTDIHYEGNIIERSISRIFANVLKTDSGKVLLENMLQPVLPSSDSQKIYYINSYEIIDSLFRTNSIVKGQGDNALCGQQVNVNYVIKTIDDKVIEKQDNFNIYLGKNSIINALDNITVGMQLGEERNGIAIGEYSYKDKQQAIINVKLNKILNPIDLSKVKIFDTAFSYQLPVICGKKVNFSLKISKINGTILYDKQVIDFILGNNEYPLIFSHILFNKPLVGTRTVILPASYLSSFKLKVQSDEYLILEIQLLK